MHNAERDSEQRAHRDTEDQHTETQSGVGLTLRMNNSAPCSCTPRTFATSVRPSSLAIARPMTGLAHSRANRNARIPATAPARRSRVTSELVQWTFENGLFAGCHLNIMSRNRRKIMSRNRRKTMSAGTQFSIADRSREQCRAETADVRRAVAVMRTPPRPALSPEDKNTSQVGRLATGPRRGRGTRFSIKHSVTLQQPADLELASPTTHPTSASQ